MKKITRQRHRKSANASSAIIKSEKLEKAALKDHILQLVGERWAFNETYSQSIVNVSTFPLQTGRKHRRTNSPTTQKRLRKEICRSISNVSAIGKGAGRTVGADKDIPMFKGVTEYGETQQMPSHTSIIQRICTGTNQHIRKGINEGFNNYLTTANNKTTWQHTLIQAAAADGKKYSIKRQDGLTKKQTGNRFFEYIKELPPSKNASKNLWKPTKP